MAEKLIISGDSKAEKYEVLYKQIKELIGYETDVIANMANISSMIHETFGFLWTGFYRVVGKQLVLGPFQGPLACSRIKYGNGVCGMAWKEEHTLVVPDVEQFSGHISCCSLSRSEIVIPVWVNEVVVAVLDIDSKELSTFDEVDRLWLEKIVALLDRA